MIHWAYLLLAILFEGAGTIMMKLSSGGENMVATVLIGVFFLICFGWFTLALKGVPLSIAYALWSGIGIIIAVTAGYLLFDEALSALKVFAIAMIIAGVALLNYASN